MPKIKTSYKNLSSRKLKRVMLPVELIFDIFDLSSFGVKKRFKLTNWMFYNYYWKYVKEMKNYLNPKEHVLCTRGGTRPRFYEFYGVFKDIGGRKWIEFLRDQKKIRRLMKFTREHVPYCRVPTNDYSNIYKLDRSEMNYIGKSRCNECKVFDYCGSCKFWMFNLNGEIHETHVYNLYGNCSLHRFDYIK